MNIMKTITRKNKDLLLKDLCARLPYGVKVQCLSHQISLKILSINPNGVTWVTGDKGYPFEVDWKDCKPYLFPLSSMTEEQKNELIEMEWSFDNSTICNIVECFGTYRAYVDHSCCSELVDWCIKNHFDIHGLIPMGLANDSTSKNIY